MSKNVIQDIKKKIANFRKFPYLAKSLLHVSLIRKNKVCELLAGQILRSKAKLNYISQTLKKKTFF